MAAKTIIVTGAAGFVGRHVVQASHAAGARVGAIGHGVRDSGAAAEHAGDVSSDSLTMLSDAIGAPDAIIHCAGGSSVGASIADPAADFERTVSSTAAVLRFATARAPRARVVLTSSAAVYGAAGDRPIREDAALAPVSPYGVHKAAAETLARGWRAAYGIDIAILRFFSIYGVGLRKQLLWELSRRFLRGEHSPELFGDGGELRDFIDIDDAVRLILLTADPALRPPLVLNAGAGVGVSVREAAEALAARCGAKGPIRFNGVIKRGDPRALVADTSAAQAFGFEPRVRFEDGVARFAAWAREQPL